MREPPSRITAQNSTVVMDPCKKSSEPPVKSKMGQKSSKAKGEDPPDSACQLEVTSSSSSDEDTDLNKENKYVEITCSNSALNQDTSENDTIPSSHRITSSSSENDQKRKEERLAHPDLPTFSVESDDISNEESPNSYHLSVDGSNNDEGYIREMLSGLVSQLSVNHSSCGLRHTDLVNTQEKSDNIQPFQNTSRFSSSLPSLSKSHFSEDESTTDESGTDSSSELAYEESDGTYKNLSEASILPAVTLTKKEALIPTDSERLSRPPVVSFYIPREYNPPKTKDAIKLSITPFQRIKAVTKSKLFSNSVAESTSWKLKKLWEVWSSIKNLNNVHQWEDLKRLDQPVLINLKLVELRYSFASVVARVSDFKSCSTLFDILGEISLSKFEYHKTEVMKEVATPMFISVLQRVVDAFHTHLPNKSELTCFVENLVDVYVDIFLQLDSLATDGLAEDLTKVIESLLQLFNNKGGNSNCTQHLEQLLQVINSRGSLIRANSCFPVDIMREEPIESNIIDRPFDNFDHYLSVHYRLLKEDFQFSLREGIIQYLKTLFGYSKNTMNYHLTIYPNVTLTCSLKKYAVKYKLFFHNPALIRRLQDPACRSFLHGALLVLTPCVSRSNPPPFEFYYLVRVEDRSPLEREKSYIVVSMVFGITDFFYDMELMMAEPSQLFEPYYRVLNMIKSLETTCFPFTRYIVDVKTDVFPPAYMKPSTILKIGNSNCSLWDNESWPNPEDMKLNPVQLEGLKLALRSELAIIQGPPGTGKTYLSQKIVEVLLQNKSIWHTDNDEGAGMILVVCFKNQSLDQLLCGLVNAGKKVLRVGTQSKAEMLDEFNLKTLDGPKHSKIYFRMRNIVGEEQLDVMDELTESIEVAQRIKNLQGLIKLDIFSSLLHLSEENFVYLKKHFEDWLVSFPFPMADFNKVEQVLLGCKCVNKDESTSNFYQVSFQEIQDTMVTLNSKIDVMKQIGANDYVHDLIDAVSYLVRKLAFMKDRLYELSRPLTCEVHMKMMHLKATFESPNRQPSIEKLPLGDRWLLYKAWVNDLYQFHTDKMSYLTRKSQDLKLRYVEIEELLNVRKIAQCDAEVIGMTTTAAAKYYKTMECLKPKIVLVEEAAEVVEAHTIASLSKHCQHLILVGDHKQLRPLTSSYIIGKNAHLDISMYERLVRNGLPHCTLNTQYRMRPEIAALIAPAVYSDLTNHPSVEILPHVLGVPVDVYFVDHSAKEDETPDIMSKWNRFEAEFLLALCNYLVKQGYQPSQITILATYSEQEKYFNKEKLNYPDLEEVLMATVDSFQGKENDIILLSLVRSNNEGNIGFLAQKNRINVALSRAKQGLFIIGNSTNLLAKGGLWDEVIDVLSKNNAIGSSLPLKCEIHGTVTRVKTPGDVRALKNGGCSTKCQAALACGHNCIHLCHPMDRNHENIFKCSNLCNKVMECFHSCILACHIANDMIRCFCKSCTPKTKCEFKFPCGHICKSMGHAEDIEHKARFQCSEICNTVLNCGHTCASMCHLEDVIHSKRYKCPIPCEGTLFCGHRCKKKSQKKHICSDHYSVCVAICAVEMPCGHVCRRICHIQDRNHETRQFMCIQCGTNSLTKASVPIVDVIHPVVKGEELKISDSEKCLHGAILNSSCDKLCGFTQRCGHLCREKCHSAVGNHIQVCKEKCDALLKCGHRCQLPCHILTPYFHDRVDVCKICDDLRVERCSHGLVSSCKEKCGFEYKCGHSCNKLCRHTIDATHSNICKRECNRLFKCGHPCKLPCHFEEQFPNHLSFCYTCEKSWKTCEFKYECGHSCLKKIGHFVDSSHSKVCKQNCNQLLSCGHSCKLFCHFGDSARHGAPSRCRKCMKTMCSIYLHCGHRCGRRNHTDSAHACSACSVKEVDYEK